MKKLTYFISLMISLWGHAQQSTLLNAKDRAHKYYLFGLQYKNGNGVPMDYGRAYGYFDSAAALGNMEGKYAVAYMSYKGLGCAQDYAKAAALFAEGANLGRDNSMYFYGLCLRNGYGVDKNTDSALYWLRKADSLGSKQAKPELQMLAAENENDSALALLRQIHNAALPEKTVPNTFHRIPQHLPIGKILSGRYMGYILQYDWSGKNLVSARKLVLDLEESGGRLSGRWVEDGADSVRLEAFVSGDSVRFRNTSYKRRDHYSPDSAVGYRLDNALFNLVQGKDSVFLAGNVQMFSPMRGEPSKPNTIALTKTGVPDKGHITFQAFPNPFRDNLEVRLNMVESSDAVLRLIDMGGTVVYMKTAKHLPPGNYSLALQPGNIASGTYILELHVNSQVFSVKVIKR